MANAAQPFPLHTWTEQDHAPVISPEVLAGFLHGAETPMTLISGGASSGKQISGSPER